jgi:uncharacterized protein YdeI (YjbR/CyaY-like superfamily)
MRKPRTASDALPTLAFPTSEEWAHWLDVHHGDSTGVWLRLAKKGCDFELINHREALEEALCYGWIDGQLRPESDATWLVKFIPRRNQSIWSKINREKALALIESGRMKPAGLREVERARADGRWEAAYDSFSKATVPTDLEKALDRDAQAKTFFAALDRANRYAVLWRIQTAKRPETRARRIQEFVAMLARHEKLHP